MPPFSDGKRTEYCTRRIGLVGDNLGDNLDDILDDIKDDILDDNSYDLTTCFLSVTADVNEETRIGASNMRHTRF